MIRNTIKLAAFAAASLTFAGQAFAQNQAVEATQGTATIAAPIAVTENSALAFGSLTRPSSGNSTVTLDSSTANCARGITGNGVLISSTSSCATYTVTGQSGQAFNIATDATFDMTRASGTETLTVTLNKSATTGTVGAATADFKVGGSFPVTAATVAGAYTGSFNVTVTYQ